MAPSNSTWYISASILFIIALSCVDAQSNNETSSTEATDIITDNIPVCGISALSAAQGRIVGGRHAQPGQLPWQVSIQAFGTHFCGAMIIDERYVLTAGHCAVAVKRNRLQVVVGEVDIRRYDPFLESEREQRFNVEKVIVHRKFQRRTLRYDIALLKLDGRIRFHQNARPICLPTQGEVFHGRIGVVSGWGKLEEKAPRSTNRLNLVRLPIITNTKCQSLYDNEASGQKVRIRAEWLCAGFEGGQRDACQGDSGGPMATQKNGRWFISGITSGGFGCARKFNPGIFTRVSNFVNWIQAKMRAN